MDPFRADVHAVAGDAATGESDRHPEAHGGTDLPCDARSEPERHADTNANVDADAHTGALAEPDGHRHTDANAHACADVNSRHYSNGVAHPHAHAVADAHLNTAACRWNVLSAQQPYATAGRLKLST